MLHFASDAFFLTVIGCATAALAWNFTNYWPQMRSALRSLSLDAWHKGNNRKL